MTGPFKPKVIKVSPEDIAAMKAVRERLATVETPGQKVNTIIGELVEFVKTLTIEDAETLARDVRRLLEDIIDVSKQATGAFSAHSPKLRASIIEKGITEALLKYGFKVLELVEAEETKDTSSATDAAELNQADTTDLPFGKDETEIRASEDVNVRIRNLEASVQKLLQSEEDARTTRMLEKKALEDTLKQILEALRKS